MFRSIHIRSTSSAVTPIGIIGHTAGASTTGSSVTTPGIITTGASLIIVNVAIFTAGTPTAPTDNMGNTGNYTLIRSDVFTGVGTNSMYLCTNPITGAGHTFTSSPGGVTPGPSICVLAVSNTLLVSPLDQQNGTTVSGGTSITLPTTTPLQANEILVTGVNLFNLASTPTIDSSFIISDHNARSVGLAAASSMAYLIQTTAVGVGPKWTFGGGVSAEASIASFKHS